MAKEAILAVNRDKPDLWKSDVARSVDMYNTWFLEFAPEAFRTTRVKTTQDVEHALRQTDLLWLGRAESASDVEILRAATIVADRLCGAVANPIIRNAQEQRQLAAIGAWLEARGYVHLPNTPAPRFGAISPGTFSFHLNIPAKLEDGVTKINLPIDAVVLPKSAGKDDFPLLFEAKSAGDYTNVNKRRKEEAAKMSQLRRTYGDKARLNLFLCGYFDTGYLGYEAAEGIDWVWEHRIDDMELFGL